MKTNESNLRLVAAIRSQQNVQTLDQPVTVWVAELWYDVTFNSMGKDYANCDQSYHATRDTIDTDIEIGQQLQITPVELPYRDLIGYYLTDEMYRLADLSNTASSTEIIEPSGDNIEGAVLVEWSWEKYVGYARNLHSLRFGNYNETEADLVTGNEERTFRHNLSLLVEADKLSGLSNAEKIETIREALDHDSWKWNYFHTPNFTTLIADSLGLSADEEDEEEE